MTYLTDDDILKGIFAIIELIIGVWTLCNLEIASDFVINMFLH